MKAYYSFFLLFCQVFFAVCVVSLCIKAPITWFTPLFIFIGLYLVGASIMVYKFLRRYFIIRSIRKQA